MLGRCLVWLTVVWGRLLWLAFGLRRAQVACHRKLVVLNLSGTGIAGNIQPLAQLPLLQVHPYDYN